MNFCPRQFNVSKIFGVSAYELQNHEIKYGVITIHVYHDGNISKYFILVTM